MTGAILAAVAALAAPQVPSGLPVSPPQRTLARYCSQSGDLCYGIAVRRGALRLELDTIERYFGRYRLCVRPPRGSSACRRFSIRRTGRIYGSDVFWRRSFPHRGSGTYRVNWQLGGRALGPTLRFRLPLRG